MYANVVRKMRKRTVEAGRIRQILAGGVTGNHAFGSKALASGLLLLMSLGICAVAAAPAVSAQTPQYVVATPNYINLGMNTTITVTAPGSGTYSVVVQAPSGAEYPFPFNFGAAGQVESAIFGNATVAWKAVATQVGTYDIFLEQGAAVVSSTTFLVTNKINISFGMIYAGLCTVNTGGTRGDEMLAQFHITYVSNGAVVENASTWVSKTFTISAAKVTYTLPDGTIATAKYHAGSAATDPQPWYTGHVWPAWNSSWVTSNYQPTIKATDQYGNTGTYKYVGYPYIITPITFGTTISLSDAKTGAPVTGLYNGQSAIVTANIQYLSAADTVAGTAGPLDTATRGGVVTAVVGWGPYNATSGQFGAKNLPGGLIANVPMTYSTATKVWTGPLNIATLPTLVNATAYEVIVNSHDSAQPPNTGSATLNLPLATLQPTTGSATTTATVTTTAVSTTTATVGGAGATSTATVTSTAPGATVTSTAPGATVTSTAPGATSTATSVSVVTSVHTSVLTTVQSTTAVPWWAYALIVVFLVEIGIPIGYMMKSISGGQRAPQK